MWVCVCMCVMASVWEGFLLQPNVTIMFMAYTCKCPETRGHQPEGEGQFSHRTTGTCTYHALSVVYLMCALPCSQGINYKCSVSYIGILMLNFTSKK